MINVTTTRRSVVGLLLAVLLLAGCDPLAVSDPTAIEDEELNNAAGAELLRSAALASLYTANSFAAYNGGLFADEFIYDLPRVYEQFGIISEADLLDRRESEAYEASGSASLWHSVRTAANIALPKVERYAVDARVGEMLSVRGFATLRLAEDYCPGFPLHEVTDYAISHTPPLSTDEALELAVADFDSALVHAADSARILNLARVFRGRALLGLGRYAEAAASVHGVSTEFRQTTEHTLDAPGFTHNRLGQLAQLTTSVANGEGGNGLNFVEAQDPRLPVEQWGTAQDGATPMFALEAYPDGAAPMPLATGIEARLIEAEAALHEDGDWLQILNDLRAGVSGLAPLADPGTHAARVDLLFRERAFWLFGGGHRLADLRRLVRQYGRQSEEVFPTGMHWRGRAYGTGTSIPFAARDVQPHVPAVTGCTSE